MRNFLFFDFCFRSTFLTTFLPCRFSPTRYYYLFWRWRPLYNSTLLAAQPTTYERYSYIAQNTHFTMLLSAKNWICNGPCLVAGQFSASNCSWTLLSVRTAWVWTLVLTTETRRVRTSQTLSPDLQEARCGGEKFDEDQGSTESSVSRAQRALCTTVESSVSQQQKAADPFRVGLARIWGRCGYRRLLPFRIVPQHRHPYRQPNSTWFLPSVESFQRERFTFSQTMLGSGLAHREASVDFFWSIASLRSPFATVFRFGKILYLEHFGNAVKRRPFSTKSSTCMPTCYK